MLWLQLTGGELLIDLRERGELRPGPLGGEVNELGELGEQVS